MQQEHFLRNIKIIDFKCFKNFKAKDFKRVNLISGKNNVGKTAFMEACYLGTTYDFVDIYKRLLEVETHRDVINFLIQNDNNLEKILRKNTSLEIISNDFKSKNEKKRIHNVFIKENIKNNNFIINAASYPLNCNVKFNEFSYNELINRLEKGIENKRYIFSKRFVSVFSNETFFFDSIISESKLSNKYDDLNNYLFQLFNIKNIDIINGKVLLKVGIKYLEISQFGQGIKSFINIICSILILKDDVIFIDEIDNGIHHTKLEKLWELIFTISKEVNCQVFATTHSKEMINAFAKVSQKLKDDDMSFIELGRNKENEIKANVYDQEMFLYELNQNHELRGW